jgi:tRNA (cytidine/uridine-2'-O-)-methyltransferase
MKIVLFQPQIPQNTGNVARTCSVTNAELVLVHPLGFSTQSRWLKRAGLDYWEDVSIQEIDHLESYLEETSAPFFFFSSKAKRPYTEAPFTRDSLLIFGSETEGLPSHYLEKWEERFYTIPMIPKARCLNLATSAAVVLYEALRQTHFFETSESKKEKATLIKRAEVTGT